MNDHDKGDARDERPLFVQPLGLDAPGVAAGHATLIAERTVPAVPAVTAGHAGRAGPDRPDFARERYWHARGALGIAGVDEVGRGALAGPVVAAAVILPATAGDDPRLAGVGDSKQLAPCARAAAAEAVRRVAHAVGLGAATPAEIDALGIAAATHLAMRRALAALGRPVAVVLVDGRGIPPLAAHQEAIVRGDARVLSIASASVVAKVMRDGGLCRADLERPGYGLGTHKGYGTAAHLAALAARGPAACHRRTWAPVVAARRP